jgi:hypothetical protein
MNVRQASLLRGRLSARYPGVPVDVTPHSGGATIFIRHHDGGYTQIMTGDTPGMVLRMVLGRDLRVVGSEAGDGSA